MSRGRASSVDAQAAQLRRRIESARYMVGVCLSPYRPWDRTAAATWGREAARAARELIEITESMRGSQRSAGAHNASMPGAAPGPATSSTPGRRP